MLGHTVLSLLIGREDQSTSDIVISREGRLRFLRVIRWLALSELLLNDAIEEAQTVVQVLA